MYLTHFVGRQRELQQLVALSKAPKRATPIVLLGASAGMGKSRLIAEYRSAAEPARVVVVGSCLEFAGGILAPFAQVIRALAQASPQTLRDRSRLFERLGVLGDNAAEPREAPQREEKLRLFELYASALVAFSQSTPVTIVLEDIQWADSNSLELIQYLAGMTLESNLVVIATYRNDDLSREQPLRHLIGRLSPIPSVMRVDLLPLDDNDIDLLIHGILAGTSIDKTERNAIRVRAEGNPLFAEELARHVREHPQREHAERLPLSIEEAVCARLPLLSSGDAAILLRAAVLGRTFDATTLSAISGEPLSRVLEALRRARDLAFISESRHPNFTFRHALTREALYNELLEAERRTIHAQTLAILESRSDEPAPIGALAYHAWAAHESDRSMRYSEQAGDAAAKAGAVLEATEAYERALDMCGAGIDAARLYEKLASARLGGGFPERSIAAYDKALELRRRENDRAGIAECAIGIAEAYAYLGDEEQGLAYLDEARNALADEPQHHLRVRALLYSARIALADNDTKLAFGHLATVEEFCESLDNRSAVLFFGTRAEAKLMQRRYDEAIADQTRALELATGGPSRRLEAEQRGLLGSTLLIAGRLELAASAYREAFEVAEANFDVAQAALFRAHYAEVRSMLGFTHDAKSIAVELLALAVQTENPAFIVLLGRVGIFISLRTGDEALGQRIVDRLDLDERFRLETPPRLFPISGAYAQWLFERGRTDEAKVVLRRAVDRLSRKRLRSTDWSICTLMTVAAHGSVDDIAAAREVLASSFLALGSAFLSFFDAIAARRAHRDDEARTFARAAATGLRPFQFRYEEALAWELADEKQVALDLFIQQGANQDVRRVQRSMMTINRRGRGEKELTSREHEIARAMAAGETNRMIAERYCITEKTVETHVASTFNRLGIRSRGEVAARLTGLVAADGR